jgi:CRISPR-associated endoribonuclease Cas6
MILAAIVLLLEGSERPEPAAARAWLAAQYPEAPPGSFTVAVGGTSQPFIRYTFLVEEIYSYLSPALFSLAGTTLILGENNYRIREVLQEGHAWSGLTTWPKLMSSAGAPTVSLSLASPTLFRHQGHDWPVLDPKLLVRSLVQRFNAFAPLTVPEGIAQGLADNVFPSHYRLHTVFREPALGFVGSAQLVLAEPIPEWQTWLAALARLAFYSGVGAKTALGFGQARAYLSR